MSAPPGRWGSANRKIMFRHILPNAMVATLTMLPFIVTGTIGGLAALDFLGYRAALVGSPSLGEMARQAKQNLQAPWLAFTAFFTFAIMLSLLVFIFEGVRDAFDPRKTLPMRPEAEPRATSDRCRGRRELRMTRHVLSVRRPARAAFNQDGGGDPRRPRA